MNVSRAEGLASGYAWGREDATGVRTATTDDRNGSYLFSRAYGHAQAEYNNGRRTHMMSVQDAYARWQATSGMTVEDKHSFEWHVLTAARSWIADQFPETDATSLTDQEVRSGMDRWWIGGWPAFRRREHPAYFTPRAANQPYNIQTRKLAD
jgi:hypothetical protein